MTTYEIALLVGSFAGVFAFAALASVVLDRGSVRIFVTLAVISGAALYFANVHSEDGLDVADISPAINKLIVTYIR